MALSKDFKNLLENVSKDNVEKHKVIPTDIISLDYILGGGIELGSKIQFVAESSTGKTTIVLNICRNFCKKGLNVLYIDTENSVTQELLKSTKCEDYLNYRENSSVGHLVLIKESDFNTISQKLDVCLQEEYFKLVIIDSLASMVNNCYVDFDTKKKKIELTNSNTNYESRPINLFINKYSSLANKYNVAFLYINQYRNKVDPLKGTVLKEFGNKIVRYNSDVIIKIKKEKEGFVQDGNGVLITDIKMPLTHNKLIFTIDKSNKLLSGTYIETYIKYGYGIDKVFDKVLDMIKKEEITKNGKYYTTQFDGKKNQHDGFQNLMNYILINHIIDEDGKISTNEEYDSFDIKLPGEIIVDID